jgi:hypothetical protein
MGETMKHLCRASLRLSLICVFLSIAFASISYADILPLKNIEIYKAQPIETPEVTTPDYTRRDNDSTECLIAGSGLTHPRFRSPFSLSSVRVEDVTPSTTPTADVKRCWVTAHDYVELAPGLTEPKKICLHSFVKSKGGILAAGGRGYLTCQMTFQQHDPETPIYVGLPTNGSINETTPSLPADTNAEIFEGSFITIKTPFRAIEERLNIELKKAITKIPGFGLISVEVLSQNFARNSSNPHIFTYNIVLEGTVALVGFKCDVNVRFGIPAARLATKTIQDYGSSANCGTGSFLGQLINFPTILENEIIKSVLDAVSKSTSNDDADIATWIVEDPELVQDVFSKAWIQGKSCRWRTEEGICLTTTWSDQKILRNWLDLNKNRVQNPNGLPDATSVVRSYEYYKNIVGLEGYYTDPVTGKKSPTGYKDFGKSTQQVEDGDMMLFSGLLCYAGISEGCELVKNSISNDGRPWRSPRRVGELDKDDYATFSGDQLKGLILYWLTMNDRDGFVKFLKYIKTQKTLIPSNAVAVETGYSSCTQRYPNFTCVIAADWPSLFALANKFGVLNELPADFANTILRYEITEDDRRFDALTAVAGYRLHLVALNELILSKFNSPPVLTPLNEEIFQIVSARQPNNPFFAYLRHGKSKLVQDLADAKCPVFESRNDRSDWTWQRGDTREAWKNGMGWDCLFIFKLLQ